MVCGPLLMEQYIEDRVINEFTNTKKLFFTHSAGSPKSTETSNTNNEKKGNFKNLIVTCNAFHLFISVNINQERH
jgi:hypothetical protein